MTITQMLGQSGLLTLLGMCVVFSFIIILILSMKLLHLIVHACKLDKPEASKATSGASSQAPAPGQDTAVIAAIAAAVRERQSL